jgi:hypothetical protein
MYDWAWDVRRDNPKSGSRVIAKQGKKKKFDKHEAALFPISFGPQEHVLN